MSTWTEETCPDLDATAPLGVASVDVATEELTRVLPQAAPSWVLVAVEGPEAGRRIEVGAGKTSVGRGVRCDVRLEDPAVSRMHLWLEGCDEGVRFEEACVKNGTRLEGRPCAEGMAVEGQRIAIGQSVFVVRRGGEEEGRSPNVVEQALRLLRFARRVPPLRPRIRALWPLLFGAGIAVIGGVILGLGPRPAPAPAEEGLAPEHAARRAFDRGLELVRAGSLDEARPHFERAAREDPESEEPRRYLRWLDARTHGGRSADGEEGGDEGAEVSEPEGGGAAERNPPVDAELGSPTPEPARSERAERVGVPAGPAPAAKVPDAVGRTERRSGGTEADAPSQRRARRAEGAEAPSVVRRKEHRTDGIEAARAAVRDLLARARDEEGGAAVATLQEAWARARTIPGEAALVEEIRARLAERAHAVGEDALLLGRLHRAAAHFRLALEARPDHTPARERIAQLQARAESFLVEGYSLRERDPVRAREWLELVLTLTKPQDPLHQRARKWLEATTAP